jgi:hypothetical protein
MLRRGSSLKIRQCWPTAELTRLRLRGLADKADIAYTLCRGHFASAVGSWFQTADVVAPAMSFSP